MGQCRSVGVNNSVGKRQQIEPITEGSVRFI